MPRRNNRPPNRADRRRRATWRAIKEQEHTDVLAEPEHPCQ